MAGGIFISYRRDDSRHAAGRLVDRLAQTFRRDQLFMDVDAIEPGLDFVKVLNEKVAACDVLLAVIGPQWIFATDPNGQSRLQDPNDFVRVELEAALQRDDIRLIPVLVDGAQMPRESELPEPLRQLARRNAVRLTHERFGTEAAALATSLKDVVSRGSSRGWWRKRKSRTPPQPTTHNPLSSAGPTPAQRSHRPTEDFAKLGPPEVPRRPSTKQSRSSYRRPSASVDLGRNRYLLGALLLALLVASGWVFFGSSLLQFDAPSSPTRPSSTPDKGERTDKPISKSSEKSVGSLEERLLSTATWRIIKQEFPDWHAERLKETAALAAQNKADAEIRQHLAQAVVRLRRQHANHALAASSSKIKAVMTAFHASLKQLKRHSVEACYSFISKGEASPTIVSLMQDPLYASPLLAQTTAAFEAIADGRKTPRVHQQPSKSDYDALAGDLAKRGWSQADMQLFSDEKALSRAPPEKVCQLVHDWIAAQLDIKDPDTQLRLLADTLKPVVAG